MISTKEELSFSFYPIYFNEFKQPHVANGFCLDAMGLCSSLKVSHS